MCLRNWTTQACPFIAKDKVSHVSVVHTMVFCLDAPFCCLVLSREHLVNCSECQPHPPHPRRLPAVNGECQQHLLCPHGLTTMNVSSIYSILMGSLQWMSAAATQYSWAHCDEWWVSAAATLSSWAYCSECQQQPHCPCGLSVFRLSGVVFCRLSRYTCIYWYFTYFLCLRELHSQRLAAQAKAWWDFSSCRHWRCHCPQMYFLTKSLSFYLPIKTQESDGGGKTC